MLRVWQRRVSPGLPLQHGQKGPAWPRRAPPLWWATGPWGLEKPAPSTPLPHIPPLSLPTEPSTGSQRVWGLASQTRLSEEYSFPQKQRGGGAGRCSADRGGKSASILLPLSRGDSINITIAAITTPWAASEVLRAKKTQRNRQETPCESQQAMLAAAAGKSPAGSGRALSAFGSESALPDESPRAAQHVSEKMC